MFVALAIAATVICGAIAIWWLACALSECKIQTATQTATTQVEQHTITQVEQHTITRVEQPTTERNTSRYVVDHPDSESDDDDDDEASDTSESDSDDEDQTLVVPKKLKTHQSHEEVIKSLANVRSQLAKLAQVRTQQVALVPVQHSVQEGEHYVEPVVIHDPEGENYVESATLEADISEREMYDKPLLSSPEFSAFWFVNISTRSGWLYGHVDAIRYDGTVESYAVDYEYATTPGSYEVTYVNQETGLLMFTSNPLINSLPEIYLDCTIIRVPLQPIFGEEMYDLGEKGRYSHIGEATYAACTVDSSTISQDFWVTA